MMGAQRGEGGYLDDSGSYNDGSSEAPGGYLDYVNYNDGSSEAGGEIS